MRVKDPALLDLEDDFEAIKAHVTPTGRIRVTSNGRVSMFWAERPQVAPATLDYKSYSCPLISRVTHKAFFFADGTWYACCFDSNNQLVLWVYTTSSIFPGDARKRLVKLLTERRFDAIGGPCATVNSAAGSRLTEPLRRRADRGGVILAAPTP